jgi:hypothetical protein
VQVVEGPAQEFPRIRNYTFVLVEVTGAEEGVCSNLDSELRDPPEHVAQSLTAPTSDIAVRPPKQSVEVKVREDDDTHRQPKGT